MKLADKYPDIDTRTPDLYRAVLEAVAQMRAQRIATRTLQEARSPRFAYRCRSCQSGRVYALIE